MAKLTEKQKRFCDEYLIDFNATQAYIRSGYAVKKKITAEQNGAKLLKNTKVQEYITERQKAIQRRTEITQDKVLNELAKVAFTNGSDFAKVVTKPRKRRIWDDELGEYVYECDFDSYDQYVELKDTDELPEEKRAAISSIKETKHGIEVNSYDKVKALELIGRHIGMFKDKLEISGQVNNPFDGISTEELKKIIYDNKTAT